MTDIRQEATLPEDIRPLPERPAANPREILITGASGFLGGFLLAELLSKTDARMHCLVRGETEEAAETRLIASLAAKDLWRDTWAQRLVVYPGDLEAKDFGLKPETIRYFEENVDSIYHCGARIHFGLSYEGLKQANVDGTLALIQLACSVRPKAFHYISSLGVFEQLGVVNTGMISEDTVPELLDQPLNGYSSTKLVAERLVDSVRQRGLTATIYRPGSISASGSGVWNHSDMLPRAIKGCLQIGAFPRLPISLSLTPVDFVAKAIVSIAQSGPPYKPAYHPIADEPVTFEKLFGWLLDGGYSFDILPFSEWQECFGKYIQSGQRNALGALAPLLLAPLPKSGNLTLPELFIGDRRPHYANDYVAEVVGRETMAESAVNRESFRKCMARWIREGYVPPPKHSLLWAQLLSKPWRALTGRYRQLYDTRPS